MTDSIRTSKPYPKLAIKQGRWEIYLLLALLANAAIWASALIYLKIKKPIYSSTWAVTLPGLVSEANVSLPNIGQASYQNSSPYGVATQDPRENYKFIAQSEPVLKAAAAQLNMPLSQFGQPRIKLADSTTIMEFEFKGMSPEEARTKSLALYKALQARLTQLRAQEAVQRDQGFQSALSASQRKLEIAHNRLSEYKAHSLLNSNDQIKALSNNIEQLRAQRAEILAQQQQSSGRLKQLSANLNLSSQQATDAFTIQTDQIFQQNLKAYSESSGALVVFGSKYSSNHPTMVAERAKQEAAQVALLSRAQSLLGRPINLSTIQQLNLSSTSSSAGRESLFQELVKVQADQKGFESQAQGITQQIRQLEGRLKNLAQQESTLDTLNRDAQVAEAVFSSTLARLDIGRSNAFGSYPLIQILAEPSLSKTPTSPKKNFILLGAVLGSLFLNTGLVLLWLRQRKIWIDKQERELETSKYLKNELSFTESSAGNHFFKQGLTSGLSTRETSDEQEKTRS